MNVPKRMRAKHSKLQKGLTAQGAEFYYSKKPDGKKADYVGPKAKPQPKASSVREKKKIV